VKSGDVAKLPEALAARGLVMSKSLGFENTYALAAPKSKKLEKISDVTTHPELRIALSHEFAGRSDGWPGLAKRYELTDRMPTAIDHALAYEALKQGTIDVTDVYTTDAKISRYDLVVLADDRSFFPPYEAVLLHRTDALTRFPKLARVLERLAGSIDASMMQRLNARAELDRIAFVDVAREHLGGARTMESASFLSGLADSILRYGPRHIELVSAAALLALAPYPHWPCGAGTSLSCSRRATGGIQRTQRPA